MTRERIAGEGPPGTVRLPCFRHLCSARHASYLPYNIQYNVDVDYWIWPFVALHFSSAAFCGRGLFFYT